MLLYIVIWYTLAYNAVWGKGSMGRKNRIEEASTYERRVHERQGRCCTCFARFKDTGRVF